MKKNGELVVVKSNELVQKFRFSLSKMELRVINYIIANINSPLYDEEFNTITFDINEFYKAMGNEHPGGSAYDYIKKIIKGLVNKKSDYVDFGEYETIVSWIEKPKFYKQKGIVELKLDDDLKPHLLKMNGYIQTYYNYYCILNSKYSMRLYDLLKTWEKTKTKTFDVEDLRVSIDALQKSYSNFAIFELKVLEPAIKEINQFTDIFVTYTTKYRGKKISTITFEIKKNKNKPIPFLIDEKKDKEDNNVSNMEIFKNQFPDYSEDKLKALWQAAFHKIDRFDKDGNLIVSDMDEIECRITSYVSQKYSKIKATPEDTKTTEFNRLLNAVENDY